MAQVLIISAESLIAANITALISVEFKNLRFRKVVMVSHNFIVQ